MSSFYLFLLLTVAAVATAQEACTSETCSLTVKIKYGSLIGSWKTSSKGRTFASFEGIPYASPPQGKYRFQEPQPVKPWLGVWNATRPLQRCLQYNPFEGRVMGSEDCLYLHVYSPKPKAGANLPVVVFIHGGAFMFGAGFTYEPLYLMDKDMVVVTINYRLGPLGFLSTGDEIIPGNAGMKDQAMALRWIRDNIKEFGGNPDAVTLTGSSAGGASVHYHYLSPLSKGTFAQGIAYSGSAFCSWAHQLNPAKKAKALAAAVGCPTTNSKVLAECLLSRPAEVVVRAQIELMGWKVHMFTPFVPTVEAPNVKEPFLNKYPYQAAQAGLMQKVPLITSVTSEEGLYPAAAYLSNPEYLPDLEKRWEELASSIFEYNETIPLSRRAEVAAKIKQKYLDGRPVGLDTFSGLVQALGDRMFVVDVGKLAQIHAEKSGQPTYVYRYSFRGDASLSDAMSNTKLNYGVSHADDLYHILKSRITFDSEEDKEMIDVLVDMVYNYAATGVPKVTNKGPAWLPVVPGSPEINYLEISSPKTTEMKSSNDFGFRSFWDSLGFNENEKYQPRARDEL